MPDWAQHVRPRLSSLRLSPTRETEIVEELSQHLDDRWRELIAGGASPDEATPGARRLQRRGRSWRGTWRRSGRCIRPSRSRPERPPATCSAISGKTCATPRACCGSSPASPIAAILTLALGIGANTAIFSLVNAPLLQSLPVADRNRLFYIHRGSGGGAFGFSYPLYKGLRDGDATFEGLAAWGGITASLNAGDTTELVAGAIVTGNLFDVLGVRADRGRTS